MLNLCQQCSVVITCIYANCFLSARAHVRSHVTDVYDCVNPVWEVTTLLYPVLITSRSFVLNGQLGWTRWTGWTQIIIHKEQVRDVQKNNKVLKKRDTFIILEYIAVHIEYNKMTQIVFKT